MTHINAPFTPDQVASINAYQVSGMFHEFTCPREECKRTAPGRYTTLVASGDCLACPRCGYEQFWAHPPMTDWSWQVRGVAARVMLEGQPMIEVPHEGA